MIIAWPIHIVAVVVWLGGLFWLCVARPSLDNDAQPLWQAYLARFFTAATVAIIAIIASGVALVQLKFGGFAHMPPVHRANMAFGLPAIGLYGFVVAVLWRRYRGAKSRDDRESAAKTMARIEGAIAVVTFLGLAAAILSAVGRYL